MSLGRTGSVQCVQGLSPAKREPWPFLIGVIMPKYSVNTSHQTPPELFEVLNREFHFTLDPCATKETALCEKYFTPREDGLSQSWAGHSVFMNPPYDRYINKWVSKAYTEARDHHATVVCLLPASTDTKWFHHYALSGEIRFLVGRLKFSGLGRAKFASVLVIYRPQALKITIKTVQVTGYDCHHCPVWAATRNAAQAPEGAQCTNCVNEAHKAKSQRSNATNDTYHG